MASNRPTAAELLESVREFLADEAMPAVAENHVRFKLQITLNLLKLVERELRLGAQHETAEIERLQALLNSGDADVAQLNDRLCQSIRDGRFDRVSAELMEHLQKTALEKLAIDNPRYSTYRVLTGGE